MKNLEEMRRHRKVLRNITDCTKALYIIGTVSGDGGITEAWTYLNAKMEEEVITEVEADSILEQVSNECAYITMVKLGNITDMIRNLGK